VVVDGDGDVKALPVFPFGVEGAGEGSGTRTVEGSGTDTATGTATGTEEVAIGIAAGSLFRFETT
jgi:hypothetical protein